jgi:HSP20 family molecular chaperone IbpA
MIRKKIRVCRWASAPGEISSVTGRILFSEQSRLSLEKQWAPLLDVCEQQKRIVVMAELPGVKPGDITLLVHHSRIEVRGEKKQEVHTEPARYLRLERESGRFRRVVALPSAVLPEKTKAVLDNGVLVIVLVKAGSKEGA